MGRGTTVKFVESLKAQDIRVGVIGLGYVGLPLALALQSPRQKGCTVVAGFPKTETRPTCDGPPPAAPGALFFRGSKQGTVRHREPALGAQCAEAGVSAGVLARPAESLPCTQGGSQ